MPKIDIVHLGCRDPDAQCEFYCSTLGMRRFGDSIVGYDNAVEAKLHFFQCSEPYQARPNDLYWKIALSVPNIELACQQLRQRNIEINPPFQFQDVGYLAHFTDPEGYTIELIDHWFEGQRPDLVLDAGLLGGGAHFSLLTLRAADIEPVQSLCRELGMTPLAVEPVEGRGFTLYFYGFTDETPPNSDLRAVENRPWLYQRPYTVLEIQHVPELNLGEPAPPDQATYRGASLNGLETPLPLNDLMLIV
ncbi:MAG: VOC family protein [Rhizobiaceae bacterium]